MRVPDRDITDEEVVNRIVESLKKKSFDEVMTKLDKLHDGVPMKRTLIHLPVWMIGRLDAVAEGAGVTRAALIRAACYELLESAEREERKINEKQED